MLEELGDEFDIVESTSDLGVYAVVVLPDHIPLSEGLRDALEARVSAGGGVRLVRVRTRSRTAGLRARGAGSAARRQRPATRVRGHPSRPLGLRSPPWSDRRRALGDRACGCTCAPLSSRPRMAPRNSPSVWSPSHYEAR